MTLLKIITIPDSRLKTKSNKIHNFDSELKRDIKNMYEINVKKHCYRIINKEKRENDEYFDYYEKKIILQGGL